MRGTLSFSTGLELSDNPSLEANPSGFSVQSRTSLGFALNSETRTETFRFGINTNLVGELGSYDSSSSDDDFEFGNYTADIGYTREGANSALSFSGSYSRVDLDDSELLLDLDGDLDLDTFEVDGGTRESTQLGVVFETGMEGPFGLRLSLSESRTNYIDTTDPDLIDSQKTDFDALARFRLNRAVTARALAGVSREDEEDAVETTYTDRYVGVGLEGETRGGLSFTTDLLFDESETATTGGTSTEDGVGLDISLRQDRPAGSVGFAISTRIDESGRRTSAEIDRQFDLPDGGLGLSLGLLDQEGDDDIRLTSQLNYSKETPRGGFSATLSQTPTTSNGDAFLNTQLSLNYQEAINNTSSWNAELSYAESNELGGSDDDTRLSAQLSYSRELTEDWALTAGVEHIRLDDSEDGERSSNSVFLNIGRDITFGF